jgi:nucleoside phosphorylase
MKRGRRWAAWAALVLLCCGPPERALTLVLGAVPWEVSPLEQELTRAEAREVDGIAYTLGELHGMPVAIALTGVGKTNTGLVIGVLSRELRPKRVIFTGTGARVKPEIRPGYVIVAEEVFFHDAGNLSEDGMEPLPVFGPARDTSREPVFRPDPGLLASALKLAASYQPPEPIRVDGESYPTRVRAGRITTGDLFGVSQWKLDEVRSELRADLLEMEGASVGQSCQVLGVPWLLVRGAVTC